VGARTYRELEAWQLADDLRVGVIAFTASAPACRDFRFCNGIRDAAGSVCRNLAEGFGRRRPREFAAFVRIALGSLGEVQDQLLDARHRHYLNEGDYLHLWALSERIRQTARALGSYLISVPTPR
jgi:four helix bundle protein